jgi:hypothetical protein
VEIVVAQAIIIANLLPAEEALFLGAPLAHVVLRSERQRLERIADVGRALVRGRGRISSRQRLVLRSR